MMQDYELLAADAIDRWIAGAPLQDLQPRTAQRIETACLARMRHRKQMMGAWPRAFPGSLEAILVALLGGSYRFGTWAWRWLFAESCYIDCEGR